MNPLLRCGGTGVVDNVAKIILPEGRNASAVALTRLLFFKIILNLINIAANKILRYYQIFIQYYKIY